MCNLHIYYTVTKSITIVAFLITIMANNIQSYITYQSMLQNTKYILTFGSWLKPLDEFMSGRQAFKKFKCPVDNCYTTDNVNHFEGNMSKFDVILVNGRIFPHFEYPFKRYAHQIFVYVNMEPSTNYPICRPDFNGFFNLTATYKLNSDISFKYFRILDINGKPIGPKKNMQWLRNMKDVDDKFAESLQTKTKAAAWFVSNCYARERNIFVHTLRPALKNYNLTIDMYGTCGKLKCPWYMKDRCFSMLKKKYYFYLALENSLTEDYVTEKVLHALNNNVVPIVFGGANYSRFLPPGSYINGRDYNANELAMKIFSLMNSPSEYRQYFKWRNHYSFKYNEPENLVCLLCKTLFSNVIIRNSSTYNSIRTWWNPNYKKDCPVNIAEMKRNKH